MERKSPMHSSKNGMVSSASSYASEIGAQILSAGGNAFDVAVAVSYALGVSEPQASGIGGQSMALIYHAERKRYFALDGSSFAPYHYQPSKAPKSPKLVGLSASTLPSTVAFYGYLHDVYGSMPIEALLQPAIELAENGVKITPLIHNALEKNKSQLIKDDQIRNIFFKNDLPLQVGKVFRQKELAHCMRLIVKNGWKDFYRGTLAETIVEDMKIRNGWLRSEDFAQIPTPIERETLEGSYRNYRIVTFPPPGAGRVLVQLLNILELFDTDEIDPNTPLGNLILALSFQLTLRDRKRMPQNPDIYFQKSVRKMTDKSHAETIKKTIDKILYRHVPQTHLQTTPSGETTHFSVTDSHGNIVAVTQSIERVFGAKRTAKGLGFFYNNYMSAYEYNDKTHPYYLLPRNRPWSSVAPTIVTYRKRPLLVLGSPGSDRIATALAQVLVRYLDMNEPLDEAITAPRFHTTEKKQLQLELSRFHPETITLFKETGFSLKKRGAYSFYLGCVQAIELPRMSNFKKHIGVADPRRDGSASGPR